MKFLSDASVFVYNGLDLETWITDVVEKTGNSGLIKVEAAANVPEPDLIAAAEGHDHESEPDHESDQDEHHEHGLYDPHVWLDPNLAIYQVEAIRDGLIKADPDNEAKYRKNADAYIAQLMDLDRQVKEETSTFTKKKFVSFHPAFTYFAHRYGLEQVGVIEELPGKEPSAGEIAELVDRINEEGVEVIFTEPQFNPQLAEMIAEESGAEVLLESLDPLGDPDDPETDTYIELTGRNVEVMAEAMK
jgi:ABC-type Zn uptake system ZnuABC Zn-binding protein ZnuA